MGNNEPWKGIVAKSFTAEGFAAYVGELTFEAWRPQFVVLHNTATPKAADWHNVDGLSRMRGLEAYYRDIMGWSAGPHVFVADDLIWAFTPLTVPGVHSPSWNAISWGVETVGDYSIEQVSAGTQENLTCALAALHEAANLDPSTIRPHFSDPLTTHHGCPGSNLRVADVTQWVQARLSPLLK